MASLIGKLRKWLDGEENEERLAPTGELIAKNPAEKFVVSLAREIEKVMMAEMFTPPGGPVFIPREYLVYLSKEDDIEWRGDKRRGLQQGLHHVLSDRALAVLGNKPAQATSFAIELRCDEVLNAGEFRVQAVWDSETAKTIVKARQSKPVSEIPETLSELTTVRPRKTLFTIEVRRNGEIVQSAEFSKPTIVIGRGSSQTTVDLKLEGDPEISRRQATVQYENGRFSITVEGTNPIFVEGREVENGTTTVVAQGSAVEVGVYQLLLKPPERVS